MRIYGYRMDKQTWCYFKFCCCVLGFWAVVFLQYAAIDHRKPEDVDLIHYRGFRHMRPNETSRELDGKSNGDDDTRFDKLRRNAFHDGSNLEEDDVVPRHMKKYDEDVNGQDEVNMRQTLNSARKNGSENDANIDKKFSNQAKDDGQSPLRAEEMLRAQKMESIRLKTTLDKLVQLSPLDAPGELGKAVNIDKTRLPQEDQKLVEDGYNKTGFNRYVSEIISTRRRTPDLRSSVCRQTVYPADLPPTSVIICFHNEAWSTLLRTVFSVLDNTPIHLLHEIILVDDFSDHVALGIPLEEYLEQVPKVKLIRASTRLGLIGARLLGTVSATAPVLTFLDSHVECITGWLEPMLSVIRENEFTVPYPVINGIDKDNFQIFPVEITHHGLFNWMDMSYFPSPLPPDQLKQRKSEVEPIKSPTMPGGIFSISRRYFDVLGRYDPGLKLWGVENLEISFKVWLCNGTVNLLPCSHVAHVFRSFNPNLDPDFYNIILQNAMRVAYVWMDEYKYLFFNNIVKENEKPHFGDVSRRIKLRENLHCKNFDWYMRNVATDLYAPIRALAIKQIANVKSNNICLIHSIFSPPLLWCSPCDKHLAQERLWYFDNGQLFAGLLKTYKPWRCLTVEKDRLALTDDCNKATPAQQWTYSADNLFRNVLFKKCIELTPKNSIILANCNGDAAQMWTLQKFSYTLDLPII